MGVQADIKNYELGLNNFYNDMGFYPSSSPLPTNPPIPIQRQIATVYDPAIEASFLPALIPMQGAHVLYESLVGMDRRGYQKDHFYGIDLNGEYYTIGPGGRPVPAPAALRFRGRQEREER